MAAKVVSLANMKGGVGKTTIAVALAHVFAQDAQRPNRVLLIDLDSQANASFWMCGDRALSQLIESGRTVDAFLVDNLISNEPRPLRDYVHSTAHTGAAAYALFIVPCSPALRVVEREVIHALAESGRDLQAVEAAIGGLLRRELDDLKNDFDLIVFDSAPGISALTEAALRASDVVVVPTIPDFISNLGLEAFCRSVWWQGAPDQPTPWVVANMVKPSPHHQLMLGEMRAEAASEDGGFRMFEVEIPSLFAIEDAAVRWRSAENPTFLDEKAAVPFQALAAEVMEIAHAAH